MEPVRRDRRRVDPGTTTSKISNDNRECDDINGTNEKSSKIQVELCAVRLEEVQTDLVVTLTMPMKDGITQKERRVESHSELFRDVMSSFVVKDWSLFC